MTPSNTTQGAKRITTESRSNEFVKFVKQLIDGGPFDLQDSPLSFMYNVKQLVQDYDRLTDQPTAPASPSPVTEETKGELEECYLHLVVVLPMAKGYAAAHPVGNNQKMVQEAYDFVNARRASPTPSPSAPAQQDKRWAERAAVELANQYFHQTTTEKEVLFKAIILKHAPPSATPSSLSAQGGAADLHADFVEIVFSTLKEAEQMEEAWMKQFFPDTEEPSSRQRLLAELRGMLDHRLSAYPTPPNAAPEGKQK